MAAPVFRANCIAWSYDYSSSSITGSGARLPCSEASEGQDQPRPHSTEYSLVTTQQWQHEQDDQRRKRNEC